MAGTGGLISLSTAVDDRGLDRPGGRRHRPRHDPRVQSSAPSSRSSPPRPAGWAWACPSPTASGDATAAPWPSRAAPARAPASASASTPTRADSPGCDDPGSIRAAGAVRGCVPMKSRVESRESMPAPAPGPSPAPTANAATSAARIRLMMPPPRRFRDRFSAGLRRRPLPASGSTRPEGLTLRPQAWRPRKVRQGGFRLLVAALVGPVPTGLRPRGRPVGTGPTNAAGLGRKPPSSEAAPILASASRRMAFKPSSPGGCWSIHAAARAGRARASGRSPNPLRAWAIRSQSKASSPRPRRIDSASVSAAPARSPEAIRTCPRVLRYEATSGLRAIASRANSAARAGSRREEPGHLVARLGGVGVQGRGPRQARSGVGRPSRFAGDPGDLHEGPGQPGAMAARPGGAIDDRPADRGGPIQRLGRLQGALPGDQGRSAIVQGLGQVHQEAGPDPSVAAGAGHGFGQARGAAEAGLGLAELAEPGAQRADPPLRRDRLAPQARQVAARSWLPGPGPRRPPRPAIRRSIRTATTRFRRSRCLSEERSAPPRRRARPCPSALLVVAARVGHESRPSPCKPPRNPGGIVTDGGPGSPRGPGRSGRARPTRRRSPAAPAGSSGGR